MITNIIASTLSTLGVIGLLLFSGSPLNTNDNIIGMEYGYGYGYGYGYEEPTITSSSSSSGSSHTYRNQDRIIKVEEEIIEKETEEQLIEEERLEQDKQEEKKEKIVVEKKEKKSYVWLFIPLSLLVVVVGYFSFKKSKGIKEE